METEEILGFDVTAAPCAGCVESVLQWIANGSRCKWLACINPHSYVVAQEDERFRDALRAADWLIPDGSGILLASRLLGRSIRERVTGSDIFFGVTGGLNRTPGSSVFFLGSSQETLARIVKRMAAEYPAVRIAGTYSPPYKPEFSPEDTDRMIEAVNAARPDVLWVGMTAPKQECWLQENHSRVDVKFAAAIGAVFDFYAGRVQRSSSAFQKMGLEWLPRLIQEPRRLWRRTFVSAPIFLWHTARAIRIRGRR